MPKRILSRILNLSRNLFRKRAVEQALDDELRSSVEVLTREKMKDGVPASLARREALIELGGVEQVKEQTREVRAGHLLETLWQDVRYGARLLRKSPGFTAVAVLTLALGIGANTAIFSVVDAVLLRPLPFSHAERLVSVTSAQLPHMRGREASYPDFLDWRERNHTFEQMSVFRTENFTLVGSDEPQHLPGAVISADLFSLLGVTPVLGRSFRLEDDTPGAVRGTNAVILSHAFWQQRFGSDPHVLDRTINLDGRLFTIVGVAPAGFQFPIQGEPVDLWTTIAVDMPSGGNGMAAERGAHYLDVIARLKPHVTVAQAQAEMSAIATQLNKEHPDVHPRGTQVVPMLDGLTGPARPALLILLGAVGCVLLIACANLANLLLTRATTRQREMSIRAALGASRARIVRQVFTESILLSLMGGLLGLLLGLRGAAILIRIVPVDIPRLAQAGLDGRVLLFVSTISVLTALVFGLAPAVFASKFDLSESLKECGRGPSQGTYRVRTHSALIISEVAITLVLLAGAALLTRSFLNLERVAPGFDPHHVLTARLDTPSYYSAVRQLTFFGQVVERVRSLPGVRSVSGVFGLPFSEVDADTGFEIEGQPVAEANKPVTSYIAVAPNYFRTLAIPLEKGRDFTAHDTLRAPPVAIINETLATRFFPGQNPIGQRIKPGISNGYGDKEPMREIVGVVGDVKLHDLAANPEPQCYVPLAQSPLGLMTLVVRTDGDPLSLAPVVRSIVASSNKEVPVYNVRTLPQLLEQSVAPSRFITSLLGTFALLALILAGVGLYGLVSYSVSLRTHEIGVRMALGAEKNDVLRLVIGQGFKLTIIGVTIGIIATLGLMQFLSSLLYGVKATDPTTLVAAVLILNGVALLACYIPARRAIKVDPLIALRYE
jgi:putative ABC transport system permease protein